MNEESPFLSPAAVGELTGIKTGRGGKSKLQLQIEQLRTMGVPHFVNAVGRPIVAKAYFNAAPPPPPKAGWAPRRSN